jgi:hypothetical protein
VALFDERLTWAATAGMLLIVAAGVLASALRGPGVAAARLAPGGR